MKELLAFVYVRDISAWTICNKASDIVVYGGCKIMYVYDNGEVEV